jgi:hypothetical protein
VPPRDPSTVLRNAAKTPWMWGVAVGVVTIAAIAAGLGAYFGNRGVPAPVDQTAAPSAVVPPPVDSPPAPVAPAVSSPPPAASAAATVKPPVPPAVSAAQKLAVGTNASGAKPGAKPAPLAATPLPALHNCSTWRKPS